MLFEIQDILSRTKDVDKKEGALESFTQTTGPAIGHITMVETSGWLEY